MGAKVGDGAEVGVSVALGVEVFVGKAHASITILSI